MKNNNTMSNDKEGNSYFLHHHKTQYRINNYLNLKFYGYQQYHKQNNLSQFLHSNYNFIQYLNNIEP